MQATETIPSILLVDDEADIRDVLEVSLLDLGYRVLTAENGEEALTLFCREMPQVVLTDIKMPGMDGIALLRRIKSENPEAEVIMITGHGDMDLAIESLKHEATDFITKPIDVDALELSLKRAQERITMRRQLKEYTENLERLLEEKTALQDRLASLGMMIGSISHSIKGMLTGLDGGVYMLSSGLKSGRQEQIVEGCDMVRQTVDRIRKMVTDVLYYAKERDLSPERISAAAFAKEVAALAAPKIQREGISFVQDFQESAGDVNIDVVALQAALVNLLDNAVDACVKAAGKDHAVVFSVHGETDEVVFRVTDDGVGMDAETLEKLFTLFFSSKGGKGTGFGLFIANNIIGQHGGAISVKSAPGRGSEITVRIPRSPEVSKMTDGFGSRQE